MKTEQILALKIEKGGIESQIRQAQEECAELITALNHFRRGRNGARHEVAEEIADIEIMMLQLRKIFKNDHAVSFWKQTKLSILANELGVTYEDE